ncbi:disease resistance protein RGA4-like [Triticum dicoccoides]|uniref:disease resistance protein RGA4-like n=1 Tax=Triticum dicoccoides TaxID=85692 RepID=UPI0018903FCC|nr:disease resistance protein RGA4-like [Triticum dicoccoides]
MEVCRDVASALAKLHQVISDDKKLETKMRTGLRGILLDMVHLNAYIEENSKGREQGPAHEAWILQLQDLAYDIEDFVDSLYRKPKEKFPLRAVRMITATDPRPEYGDEITAFQERTARLEANKPSFPACTGQSGAAAQAASVLTAGPSMSPNGGTHTPSTSRLLSSDHGASPLVGIDRFKQDLVDLLKQVEGEPRELRVISILGVRGVGKTALARAIYQACGTFGDQEPFDCHAMVMVRPDDNEASGSNGAAELLREILIQVGNVAGQISNTSAAELENILRKDLEHKRPPRR